MFSRCTILFSTFLLVMRPENAVSFQSSATFAPRSTALYSFEEKGSNRKATIDQLKTKSVVWEKLAENFVSADYKTNVKELLLYTQLVTLLRVGVPSIVLGSLASFVYSDLSMFIATFIDAKAIEVVANDYSQYIQNILTTTGLMFSIIVGYTYYFLYQQQEAIYLAMFEEVSQAKSLLEQLSLVSQGRNEMYQDLLDCIERYVQNDLTQFMVEPSVLLSRRPMDDPLEEIMFLTSVGEPSYVYQTVRSLRQARAFRLGALQRKLPSIHFVLVYVLAAIILLVFPVLGAGSQSIGGDPILRVQSIYMFIIVFGIGIVLGVLNELVEPAGKGAYNVVNIMDVMVKGLSDEIDGRQEGKFVSSFQFPTIDGLTSSPSDDSMLFYEGREIGREEYNKL